KYLNEQGQTQTPAAHFLFLLPAVFLATPLASHRADDQLRSPLPFLSLRESQFVIAFSPLLCFERHPGTAHSEMRSSPHFVSLCHTPRSQPLCGCRHKKRRHLSTPASIRSSMRDLKLPAIPDGCSRHLLPAWSRASWSQCSQPLPLTVPISIHIV